MSRSVLLVLWFCAACSKSATNQEKDSVPPAPSPQSGGGDVIAVPKGPGPMPVPGAQGKADPAPAPSPSPSSDDDRFRLKPEEGKLAIQPPGDVKAGSEAVARIVVTPGKGYHVNTEYPIKLTLTPPAGVTLAKDKFVAGGRDKAKGDADALTEQELVIAVKLTPAASGNYTVNGNFKFAVCDPQQCLAKQENIAIAVAAK